MDQRTIIAVAQLSLLLLLLLLLGGQAQAQRTFILRAANDQTKCLDFPLNQQNGISMQIWDCNRGQNQVFFQTSQNTIVNVGTGWCLDVLGGLGTDGPRNGRTVSLWDCNQGDGQKWLMRAVGFNFRTEVVLATAPNFGLNDLNNGVVNGNQVALWQVDGTDAGIWIVENLS